MLIGEDLTRRVIGAAIEVHRALGPGLLESAYEECLFYELGLQGIRCERQIEVPVLYKLPLGHGKHLASMPLGVQATLDADAQTLTIDQPGVAPGS